MSLTLTRRHNVDRFGYLIPTRYGNVPMVGAVATYRPGEGRFGGTVAVEEGTENKIATPTTFAGWASLGGGAVLDNDGSFYPSQAKFARVTTTSFGFQSNSIPAANGQTWSVSYIARRGTGDGEPRAAIMIMNASNSHVSNINPTFSSRNIGGGWVRYEAAFTINYADTGYIRLRFYVTATNGGYHDFALPQLEQKPFPTSFVDGTRAGGRLSYPKSLIAGLNALTVAAWTSGPPYWVSGNKFLVAAQTTGIAPYGDRFALWQSGTNNRIILWVRNDANSSAEEVAYDNVWDGNWHLIVGVINKSPQPGRQPIELYVDGELVASSSNVNAVPDLSTIDETWGVQVGNWRGGLQWNGLLDELLILPYAASDEEIRAWYEADGPIPPHPDALLQWDWRAVRPATMVAL